MMFSTIVNKIKIRYKTNIFRRKSVVGTETTFGAGANCFPSREGKIIIGNNCDIHATISAKENSVVKIGDYTTLRGNTVVGAVIGIEIGNYVIISNNVTIYDNNNHPTDPYMRVEMCKSGFYSELWNWRYAESAPIKIEDNVWIGEKATILKGVTVGKGAIVGSNSVVTRNVPSYSIVAGNPARVVKYLKNEM